MSDTAEQKRIDANLGIIRAYLKENFPNYTIDEDSDLNVCYKFIVTNVELYKTYKLTVGGPRLSDKSNTTTKIQAELYSYDVARGMIEANGAYFYWG